MWFTMKSRGGYEAKTNTIYFKTTSDIKLPTAAAEIFHAYQQQYTGRLDNIRE